MQMIALWWILRKRNGLKSFCSTYLGRTASAVQFFIGVDISEKTCYIRVINSSF